MAKKARAAAYQSPFASALEGVHYSEHVWVGGTMQTVKSEGDDMSSVEQLFVMAMLTWG